VLLQMRGSIVSPPCSTTSMSASIAVCHSGASCSLGQVGDELTSIAQSDQLATARERDRIAEGAIPTSIHHACAIARAR
jgi:hypothetical protein